MAGTLTLDGAISALNCSHGGSELVSVYLYAELSFICLN